MRVVFLGIFVYLISEIFYAPQNLVIFALRGNLLSLAE